MENEIIKKLEEQVKLLQDIYTSTGKTRKAFQLTLIITVILIVLPLIASVVLAPKYLNALNFGGL